MNMNGKPVAIVTGGGTGIGAAGSFLVGVLYYGDSAGMARYLGVALIVAGVAVLRLAP